jgi:hypothetical protein
MNVFYHYDTRSWNFYAGAMPDYSRLHSSFNLYNINMAAYKVGWTSFAMTSPLGGLSVGSPNMGVSHPKNKQYAYCHARIVGSSRLVLRLTRLTRRRGI